MVNIFELNCIFVNWMWFRNYHRNSGWVVVVIWVCPPKKNILERDRTWDLMKQSKLTYLATNTLLNTNLFQQCTNLFDCTHSNDENSKWNLICLKAIFVTRFHSDPRTYLSPINYFKQLHHNLLHLPPQQLMAILKGWHI